MVCHPYAYRLPSYQSVACVFVYEPHDLIILLCYTDFAAIFPFQIPIPRLLTTSAHALLAALRIAPPLAHDARAKRAHIHVSLNTAPLAGVLLLLATGAIGGTEVRRGIVGADGVKPLDIMALFISLVRIYRLRLF
jgi:hypothetical protein